MTKLVSNGRQANHFGHMTGFLDNNMESNDHLAAEKKYLVLFFGLALLCFAGAVFLVVRRHAFEFSWVAVGCFWGLMGAVELYCSSLRWRNLRQSVLFFVCAGWFAYLTVESVQRGLMVKGVLMSIASLGGVLRAIWGFTNQRNKEATP